MSDLSPKDLVKELNSIDSMVAMKDALCDLSTHRVRRSTPMTVIDEKYLRYVELLKEVDEKYEIWKSWQIVWKEDCLDISQESD